MAQAYSYNDGIIYRLVNEEERIVPTLMERDNLIDLVHVFGHFQVDGTVSKLQEKYYWSSMVTDVRKRIKLCDICKKPLHKEQNQCR